MFCRLLFGFWSTTLTKRANAHKTVQGNGANSRNCVPFCLRQLVPMERCTQHSNASEILMGTLSLTLNPRLNVSYLVCMHYRTLVSIPLFQNQTLRPMAQIIASMSGAVLNLLLIMALGRVYEKLALKLTTWGK